MSAASDEIILGIDLGTTFSLVAYADAAGPHIIRDEAGEGRLPSVLGFGRDGKVTIGWEARRHADENPEHTVYSIKRLIGLGAADLAKEVPHLAYHVVRGERDTVRVHVNGRPISPEEISSLILRELKTRAERHFGRSVRKAVITVPAYFDDAQRQATRDAGRIAGLDVVRLVNEPTAAALAYGIGLRPTSAPAKAAALPIGDKSKCTGTSAAAAALPTQGTSQLVAVYDLGGGTFDVSILRLTGDVFEVVATHGDVHLGGDDLDRTIIELVQREVRERFKVDVDSPATRQALRSLSEEIKIRLGGEETAKIELDLSRGRIYRRALTRSEFESMIAPFVERTIESCKRALADGGAAAAQIEQVVLVGGSSRIPLVRKRVAEHFGRTPYTALNSDEVVALGAAIQGQILAGRRDDALLLDVTPLALGIETMGGAMGKLIMRNARIPCRATELFTTFVDGQTSIKINVLQGERELAADCRSLASFDLRGVPPMPAGIPKVAVSFLIDTNGILSVNAREERSGQSASIQVIPAHGLTREEVARIEADSIAHAREDMSAHRLIDLRNQVEFDTHKTSQTLTKFGHLLGPGERAELETAMQRLLVMKDETADADALHQALNDFDKMTERLANLAITATLREDDVPEQVNITSP